MEGGDYTGSVSLSTGSLRGRTVLVTGGARRVGAAIARRLASTGARLAIHFYGSDGDARNLIEEIGGGAAAFQADLSSVDGPVALLDACARKGMSPDAVVHAAASFLRRPLATTTAAEWDAVMALNLRSL